MDITIPTAIKALSASGSTLKSISAWRNKTKGYTRALIGKLKEISDNMLLCK